MASVIVPSSELDMAAAPRLGTRVIESLDSGERRVILDMTGVRLIDSAGIGVLLSAHKRAQACGGQLILRGSSKHVRQVLALTGVERALTLQA